MKLIKYGITLHRLKEDDIELVRNHRNSEEIKNRMEYRKHITPEMQKKWFNSIDNKDNYYFIIEFENKKIGLINAKNINWEAKTSEGGIFLWNKEYLSSAAPLLASLSIIDMGFYFLQLETTYANILKTNPTAIKYNKTLGYKLCENQEDIYNQLYILSIKDYENHTEKLKKAILKNTNTDDVTHLIFEEHDNYNGIKEFGYSLYKKLSPEFKEKFILS